MSAVVSALALSGCAVGRSGLAEDAGAAARPGPTTPPGMESAARFYEQHLLWMPCAGGECARLTVPLDYAAPNGRTISIALLRVRPTNPAASKGALVVNPGGPGGSGVDLARSLPLDVPNLAAHHDIIGFDPRGVGASTPIRCDPAATDGFFASAGVPRNPGEIAAHDQSHRAFGDSCADASGPLLAHMSTAEVVKDLDVLRSALREPKLNYLGFSYGTSIGSRYLQDFPAQVGRVVLDGVVAPGLSAEEKAAGQAEGFEVATREWAKACAATGPDCPLGQSEDEVVSNLQRLLDEELVQRPLPVTGDARVTELTAGWARYGVSLALYRESLWPRLNEALRSARAGDGTPLMAFANAYAGRSKAGSYEDNSAAANAAVNCLDRRASGLAETQLAAAQAARTSPTWGAELIWDERICALWPVAATGVDRPYRVPADVAPVLILGTTKDPATPYAWSVRLHEQVPNSALLTREAAEHVAYARGNACIDAVVEAYLRDGELPQPGTTCTG